MSCLSKFPYLIIVIIFSRLTIENNIEKDIKDIWWENMDRIFLAKECRSSVFYGVSESVNYRRDRISNQAYGKVLMEIMSNK